MTRDLQGHRKKERERVLAKGIGKSAYQMCNMPPKPSSSKQKKNMSAGSSTIADSIELICDGCNDTLQKKEASACKVWLHRYCTGVPISRYPDISQSFVCIPCSLIANSSVVTKKTKLML